MWEELEIALRDIRDDWDFIFGVKVLLETDEQRAELLDAIRRGWAKKPSEVIEYTMAIYQDDPFEDED